MMIEGYSFELMALRKSEVIGAIPQSQLDASNSTAPLTNTGRILRPPSCRTSVSFPVYLNDGTFVTIDVGCAFNV